MIAVTSGNHADDTRFRRFIKIRRFVLVARGKALVCGADRHVAARQAHELFIRRDLRVLSRFAVDLEIDSALGKVGLIKQTACAQRASRRMTGAVSGVALLQKGNAMEHIHKRGDHPHDLQKTEAKRENKIQRFIKNGGEEQARELRRGKPRELEKFTLCGKQIAFKVRYLGKSV